MSRKFLFLCLFTLCISVQNNCYSQCKPDWLWWKTGLISTSDIWSKGMAVDHKGNTYITGWWEGGGQVKFDSVNLNSKGLSTSVLVKYDPKGKLIWAKSFGNGNYDKAYRVGVDKSDNIYLTGYYMSDPISFDNYKLYSYGYKSYNMFLVKFNPDGKVIWAKRAGGTGTFSNFEVTGLAIDENAIITVAGQTCGMTFYVGNDTLHHNPIIPNNYDFDVYIVKFDSAGNYLWGQIPKAPISGSERVNTIKVDRENNLYIIGNFSKTMDFDQFHLTNNGCMYVVKYSPTGKVVWARTMKVNPKPSLGVPFIPSDIAIDHFKNVFISGTIELESDTAFFDTFKVVKWQFYTGGQGFLVKLDSNGKVKWLNVTKGMYSAENNTIGLDVIGNIFVSGQTGCDSLYFDDKWYKMIYGTICKGAPGFIIKYNPEGKFRWMKPTFHADINTSNCGAYAPRGGCDVDANGNIYSFGYFTGKIVFGIDTLNVINHSNLLLFKMSSDFEAGVKQKDINCSGGTDGWVRIQPTGGKSPYRFNWTGGQKTAYINNLPKGQYIYTVTDTNNCTYGDTVLLTEPTPINIAVTIKDDKDNKHTGEATATGGGGTPPYKYQWNDPANQKTAKATGLGAGNYKVTITDTNGCNKDTTITIQNTVSIEGNNPYGIRVYPNPVEKKMFFIELKNEQSRQVSYIIYDTRGNKIIEKKLIPASSNIKEQVNMENARLGIYHLNIIIGGDIFTRDMILQ